MFKLFKGKKTVSVEDVVGPELFKVRPAPNLSINGSITNTVTGPPPDRRPVVPHATSPPPQLDLAGASPVVRCSRL